MHDYRAAVFVFTCAEQCFDMRRLKTAKANEKRATGNKVGG